MERGATAPTVPPLADALRHIQMSGVFYCPSELSEPWGLDLPPMPDCVWFHAITDGTATLEVEGAVGTYTAGDLILVPHGTGHRAWGEEEAPTPVVYDLPHDYVTDNYAILRHGGGGKEARIVCGGVRIEHPAARQLVQCLPPVIHVAASPSLRRRWHDSLLESIAEETANPRPGSEAIVSRLCDIVVIQAIRHWIETDPGAAAGWLGALHDVQIGAAIAAIHRRPEHDWSVASLADEVAMSRSAFAARFTSLVGEPAMTYVARWRMHLALEALEKTDDTVAAIGAGLGYASEAAFSRAFKRVMGVSARAARAGRRV